MLPGLVFDEDRNEDKHEALVSYVGTAYLIRAGGLAEARTRDSRMPDS
jgi:hypothetical protein